MQKELNVNKLVFNFIFIINMLAADGLRSLMLMKLFPWASATYIHILEYCDERFFDFGPWLLSVMDRQRNRFRGVRIKFSI